jgi:5,10-methenyltetrahydrofolate synthetase
MMQNLTAKEDLRRQLIAARRAMPADVKAQADARIIAKLSAWLDQHQPRSLGGYLAMAGEPELMPLYESLVARGITLAMPVAVERQAALTYQRWLPGETLARDGSGMQAPAARNALIQPEVVLAPCVGFNDQAYRLGFGGGYFDRTLAVTPRPTALGIAYASARISFSTDPHDIALDEIITD